MSRPFSQTMQAYRLDLHPLWIGLLATSGLLTLLWMGWAATERVTVHETSTRVELTQRPAKDTDDAGWNRSSSRRNRASRPQETPQRWLEARFPASARDTLKPGQQAVVFIKGDAGEQTVPAVIAEVSTDTQDEQLRVLLSADIEKGAPDPFEGATPSRVRVPAGTRTHLELWLPELAPRDRPDDPERPRIPR